MPDQQTLKLARRDAAQGKSASTQAGEFVREQIHHIRRGLHGARSTKQAIAIGLSEARRAGVKLSPPKPGTASADVRRKAVSDLKRGRHPVAPSRTRSRAILQALKKEPHRTVSKAALARQAHSAALRRTPRARSASARKAAATRRGIKK
jgi:hypothetical protein